MKKAQEYFSLTEIKCSKKSCQLDINCTDLINKHIVWWQQGKLHQFSIYEVWHKKKNSIFKSSFTIHALIIILTYTYIRRELWALLRRRTGVEYLPREKWLTEGRSGTFKAAVIYPWIFIHLPRWQALVKKFTGHI